MFFNNLSFQRNSQTSGFLSQCNTERERNTEKEKVRREFVVIVGVKKIDLRFSGVEP